MKFSVKTKNKIAIYLIEGNLIGEDDGSTLLDHVNEELNKKIFYFAIDLSKVKYMNSSGIGVLISILTKIRNKEGELILIKPSEQIQKLLLITKLNRIFTIKSTEAEVVEFFSKKF